jgi:tRNA1Val (adenine37-N6)-methyltransferase
VQFYALKNNKNDDRQAPEIFHLKHFDVLQHGGVMKVGTDSFILGALATVLPGKALDIGCGTGILALMLAQRQPALSNIVGIDILREAIDLASENFSRSRWSSRLSAVHSRAQDYSLRDREKFDLIISNPPFYKDGFLPKDRTKRSNKHTVELSFASLLSAVGNLLSDKGRFSTIIPANITEEFIDTALSEDLFLDRRVEIFSRPNMAAVRNVLEFTRDDSEQMQYGELILRDESGQSYSKEYLYLTREFHRDISKM